jgi:hypothetical protein
MGTAMRALGTLLLAAVVWSGLRLVGGRKLVPNLRAPAMPAGSRDSGWKIPPPSSTGGGGM